MEMANEKNWTEVNMLADILNILFNGKIKKTGSYGNRFAFLETD
jgi:hypothetical protein